MTLKVLELHIENFMRVRVVDISPDGTIQIIAGDNAAGKTSVLNALFAALRNAALNKEVKKPIRDGEDHALVRLEIGEIVNGEKKVEYIVTRTWKDGSTSLKLEAGKDNGARYPKPQETLDGLMSKIAFDPMAFIQLKPDEQVDELLKIVKFDINVEALDIEARNIYEERTEIGRNVKSLTGQLNGLGEVEEAPAEAVLVSELIDSYNASRAYQEERANVWARVQRFEAEVLELETKLELAKDNVADSRKEFRMEYAEEPTDSDAIKLRIDSVEDTNNKVRRNSERKDVKSKLDTQNEAYNAISARLDAIDKEKQDALKRAKFPIEGLGYVKNDKEKFVTFNDIPISQISMSEQIRVSLSIAMSGKPELRIVEIRDGSLLDDATMAMIEEMAKDGEWQLFIERVGTKDENAVIIVDGEVSA